MSLDIKVRLPLPDFTLDVDLRLGRRITAICGVSGAGKTTLLDVVAGLARPQAGRIALGETLFVDTASGIFMPAHRRRIGYVFQEGRLFPHLDVRGNLAYGQRKEAASASDFADVVDLLGLGALLARQPERLSGGERQRVAIGRALLSQPDLLLMDEPLSGLDEARRSEILPYIEKLREAVGLPILYVSHARAEVERLADEIVVLERGRVVTGATTPVPGP